MTTLDTPQTTPASLAPSLIVRPSSYFEPLDLAGLFPVARPFELELGSGDGGFLARCALRFPASNFLGVERLLGRLRKIDRKGLRAGLQNLRLIRLEAAYLLEYLIPPGTVHALHVYFPDPWPKRKHRRNRLINARFTELAARALTSDGTVHLRTDDADYFAQMTTVFGANPAFAAAATPSELAEILTDFERTFLARGVATRRASYRRSLS